ncbi:MAG TPA: SIS domain-containing protein [Solirubrobacteraceae bacterium]
MSRFARPLPAGYRHLDELLGPLDELRDNAGRLERWGRRLADVLLDGGRLLAAGNGGSAAQAAHLTSELVGRYRDDRPPFSAIALSSEPSAVTAIANDYGVAEIFARQVRGHGREGDVLIVLSTSGRSPNALAAVDAAHTCGMLTWALCGPPGSPLAASCHDALCVASPHTATIQEIHLIAIHLLCAVVDAALADGAASPPQETLA